jgi:two-component system, chemotaxis family, protein-glutamate methylesterase/glutaminase
VMASTLTERNAEISLRALELGAIDYVPKPSTRGLTSSSHFQSELVEKVRLLAARAQRLRDEGGSARARPRFMPAARVERSIDPAAPSAPVAAGKPIMVQAPRAGRLGAEILAIGASTGGPQALFSLLKLLPRPFAMPIVITQHMPPTFTPILAQHIARITGFPAAEAVDGEKLMRDQVYVAPGDKHLEVVRQGAALHARITTDPPENFCRPAVDPMFRSVALAVGERCTAVVLTGMGRDGAAGAKVIHQAGGCVLAQDEATSVVWGMPRAVAETGVAELIGPIEAIAQKIKTLGIGGRT